MFRRAAERPGQGPPRSRRLLKSTTSTGSPPGSSPRSRFMRAGRSRPALAVVDQAILSGTSVITSVTVGRLAGDTDLGLYVVGLSVVLLVSAVQDIRAGICRPP